MLMPSQLEKIFLLSNSDLPAPPNFRKLIFGGIEEKQRVDTVKSLRKESWRSPGEVREALTSDQEQSYQKFHFSESICSGRKMLAR